MVSSVLGAHLGIVGEPAGGQEYAVAGTDQRGTSFSHRTHADHAAVFDDQVGERGVGPDRDVSTTREVEQLTDQ